jgi:hypothetical protein
VADPVRTGSKPLTDFPYPGPKPIAPKVEAKSAATIRAEKAASELDSVVASLRAAVDKRVYGRFISTAHLRTWASAAVTMVDAIVVDANPDAVLTHAQVVNEIVQASGAVRTSIDSERSVFSQLVSNDACQQIAAVIVDAVNGSRGLKVTPADHHVQPAATDRVHAEADRDNMVYMDKYHADQPNRLPNETDADWDRRNAQGKFQPNRLA